jgi:hypothetical protein
MHVARVKPWQAHHQKHHGVKNSSKIYPTSCDDETSRKIFPTSSAFPDTVPLIAISCLNKFEEVDNGMCVY